MARLVALGFGFHPSAARVITTALGVIAGCGCALAAPNRPATNAPSATPPQHTAAVPAKPTAITPLALNPAVQNTLGRYGNIVAAGDQLPYPLRLHLPSPADTEVRVPKPDDLLKRSKLEALANLSDDDIRQQLAAWPAYSKMSLRDQGTMLQRIQDFRDYHAKIALQKAHDMGLTLAPAQAAKFEKDYWDKRLKMDQDLVKQFQPIYQAREQKMNAELFSEFSTAEPSPSAPAPKPNPPAKPLVVTTGSTPTHTSTPIAQSPH